MRTSGMPDFPDVFLLLPGIVGASGIQGTLLPELSEEERQALTRSAGVIRDAAAEIGYV
jgi:L-lactate dehydrogenase